MSVLTVTRKCGEGIVIRVGKKRIRVSLVEVMTAHKARIAVEADKDVGIFRDEIDAQRLDAIAAGPGPETHGRTEGTG